MVLERPRDADSCNWRAHRGDKRQKVGVYQPMLVKVLRCRKQWQLLQRYSSVLLCVNIIKY